MRGVLLAFHPLRLGWSGSAELSNLMQAEWGGALQPLAGRGLMCGFYLNELVLRLLPREDPHEALFDAYSEALARLSAGEPFDAVLRSFEKRLLAELGYAPVFDHDALSGEPMFGQRGEFLGYRGVGRDVTALGELLEALLGRLR